LPPESPPSVDGGGPVTDAVVSELSVGGGSGGLVSGLSLVVVDIAVLLGPVS
jgi:hypothetical protein